MKKLICLLLALIMMLSMVACASDATETPETEDVNTEDTTDETVDETIEVEDESEEPADDTATGETTDAVEGETLGQTMFLDFQETVAANPDMTAQEIADDLITNPAILFAPATMPVEEGFLSGFTNEITGFEEGVMFAPMIGSIPFVGYVFTLGEGDDAEAFVQNLISNADMRWNICVEAEEMITDHVDNTVFFLMCPTTLEAE